MRKVTAAALAAPLRVYYGYDSLILTVFLAASCASMETAEGSEVIIGFETGYHPHFYSAQITVDGKHRRNFKPGTSKKYAVPNGRISIAVAIRAYGLTQASAVNSFECEDEQDFYYNSFKKFCRSKNFLPGG